MPASIEIAHLFPALHAKLIQLLRALETREWERPTVAGAWTVKDVASHLLDTQQRLALRLRGAPPPPAPPIRSNADLVAFINRLNADGLSRYRRLDPAELIALMDDGAQICAEHYQSLDPLGEAMFAVSWAGENRSMNWFHVAREFTERWHHQEQIRLATDRPGIMTRELYHPVLDCFMRALPFAYREQTSEPGTLVRVNVAGECGGSWYLRFEGAGGAATSPSDAFDPANAAWRLVASDDGKPVSETTIPQEIAWRLFTKGIAREEAARQVRVSGDSDLGLHVLAMVAIVG